MKEFYRIGHIETKQGLWYDSNGNFTGLIHNEFSFCKNKDLQMPYDEKIVGYLSATETLEDLYHWFTKEDIERLKAFGFRIMKYLSNDYFFKDNHWLISPKSKLVEVK